MLKYLLKQALVKKSNRCVKKVIESCMYIIDCRTFSVQQYIFILMAQLVPIYTLLALQLQGIYTFLLPSQVKGAASRRNYSRVCRIVPWGGTERVRGISSLFKEQKRTRHVSKCPRGCFAAAAATYYCCYCSGAPAHFRARFGKKKMQKSREKKLN